MKPSVVKKDKLEGVSYLIPDLERRHPCLPIDRDGRRVSRSKKPKVFTFLNNVLPVRLPQIVCTDDTLLR